MTRTETDDRPAFRPYAVRVTRREQLSPSFVRLVFTGPDIDVFGTDGLDQRIKVMLPLPGDRWGDPAILDGDRLAGMAWWERWRQLPEADRNVFRTYTVRAVDHEKRELTVDFVVHDGAGPAGTFAAQAAVGDQAVVIGPDARSSSSAAGIDFHPGPAHRLLLVGDETAVPAISAIVEALDARAADAPDVPWDVRAILEVPTPDDALPLPQAPWLHATWGHRGEGAAHGETLVGRLAELAASEPDFLLAGRAQAPQELTDVDVDHDLLWETPAADARPGSHGGFYAWLAGEAGAIKTLRRLLVRERGVDRRRVAFMGYWRAGKAES